VSRVCLRVRGDALDGGACLDLALWAGSSSVSHKSDILDFRKPPIVRCAVVQLMLPLLFVSLLVGFLCLFSSLTMAPSAKLVQDSPLKAYTLVPDAHSSSTAPASQSSDVTSESAPSPYSLRESEHVSSNVWADHLMCSLPGVFRSSSYVFVVEGATEKSVSGYVYSLFCGLNASQVKFRKPYVSPTATLDNAVFQTVGYIYLRERIVPKVLQYKVDQLESRECLSTRVHFRYTPLVVTPDSMRKLKRSLFSKYVAMSFDASDSERLQDLFNVDDFSVEEGFDISKLADSHFGNAKIKDEEVNRNLDF